jgi:hypothetical protein
MANMDAAEIRARKVSLRESIKTTTEEVGTGEAEKGALEKELALDRARLAARQRQ